MRLRGAYRFRGGGGEGLGGGFRRGGGDSRRRARRLAFLLGPPLGVVQGPRLGGGQPGEGGGLRAGAPHPALPRLDAAQVGRLRRDGREGRKRRLRPRRGDRLGRQRRRLARIGRRRERAARGQGRQRGRGACKDVPETVHWAGSYVIVGWEGRATPRQAERPEE